MKMSAPSPPTRTVRSNSPSGPNTLNRWSNATVRLSDNTAIWIEEVLC